MNLPGSTAQADLIYDVGVCNGDDSAYYLHKGYRVVGIEANPLLIPQLRKRFDRELRDGRYELVHVGITDAVGEATFWVCDDELEWSSFDRTYASYLGSRHHGVTVPTCRFGSILEKFGTPFYCKIDIEGNDHLCLEDVTHSTRPPFVSVEISDGENQIRQLEGLGYSRFKLISQTTLRQPSRTMASLKARLSPALENLLVSAEVKLNRLRSDGDWRFPYGSSGPFGVDTQGEWLSAEEAVELNRVLEIGEYLVEWFDIHASLEPTP